MTSVLRPVAVAVIGAGGVAVARHNPMQGPTVVAVAAVIALLAVLLRERGAAVAALGVGAAAAFVSPDGLGPLLVLTGVVVACDVGAVDRRLASWHAVIDGVVALPGCAGLAGSVAAQPSHRGVTLGVAAAVVVVGSALLGRTGRAARRITTLSATSSPIPIVGGLAAFVVVLAPDRLDVLGDLPSATVQAARSLAAGLAVFALVLLLEALRAERAARRPHVVSRTNAAAHRRATR